MENKEKPLLLKELKKLWDKCDPELPWERGEFNETNTLLLDDSPYKSLRNPVSLSNFLFIITIIYQISVYFLLLSNMFLCNTI